MLDDKIDEFYIFDEDDEMIYDLTADEKTLDELLAERELTFEQALESAKRYIADYNAMLSEQNLSGLSRGKLWAQFIRSCKQNITEQKRRLLCILLTGGWLLEGNHDDNEAVVRAWLGADFNEETLVSELRKRREKSAEFNEILARLSEIGKPKKIPETGDDYCAVFNLLCCDEYRHEDAKPDILKQNVINIQGVISLYPELEKLAPLVYFRIYCKNNNKLYNEDYVPTVKNLFNCKEYNLSDNGKNFKQYTKYFKLYLDLLDVFPNADKRLCEQGFLACSNLAEWGVEHIEISDDLPLTNRAIVDAYKPSIYDDSYEENPFWHDENISFYQLLEWQEQNPLLNSRVVKAVENITFGELETFLADTNHYCENVLQTSELRDIITARTYNIARALLMAQIEYRFDELLTDEIAMVIIL